MAVFKPISVDLWQLQLVDLGAMNHRRPQVRPSLLSAVGCGLSAIRPATRVSFFWIQTTHLFISQIL